MLKRPDSVLGQGNFERREAGAFHSTKISGNSGPKLNGTVLSNRKIFGKEGALSIRPKIPV